MSVVEPPRERRPIHRMLVLFRRRLRRQVNDRVVERDNRELARWDRMRESRDRLQGLLDDALEEAMLLEDLTADFAPTPTLATYVRQKVAQAQNACRTMSLPVMSRVKPPTGVRGGRPEEGIAAYCRREPDRRALDQSYLHTSHPESDPKPDDTRPDPYAIRVEAERIVGEDRVPTEVLEELIGTYGGGS